MGRFFGVYELRAVLEQWDNPADALADPVAFRYLVEHAAIRFSGEEIAWFPRFAQPLAQIVSNALAVSVGNRHDAYRACSSMAISSSVDLSVNISTLRNYLRKTVYQHCLAVKLYLISV